jgi:RimJ/RimL family protein N-acetyltransferase
MVELDSSDLHPNSVVQSLSYETKSRINSVLPEKIKTDAIQLVPIFEANFSKIRNLYRYTDEEVFKHYGSTRDNLPSETRAYVKSKEEAWSNAEWFEYVIKYEGEIIGKTYLNAGSSLDSYEIGYWLQKKYWGNEITQEIADALIHICFEELDASYFDVGCVIQNIKSRRAIEKYICRYNGSFYGFVPRTESVYHPHTSNKPTDVVKHPEWVITQKNYLSHEKGISTTIPGLSYDEVNFDGEEHI